MARANLLDIDELIRRAKNRNELSSLSSNLALFFHLIQSNMDVRNLLRRHSVSVENRVECLLSLPGFLVGDTFSELMTAGIAEGWFSEWRVIHDTVQTRIDEILNRSVVQVVSRVPLTDDQSNQIREIAQRVSQKPVELRALLDESVVGGILIILPDGRVVDLTVSSALTQLKSYVMERG